jgi:TRAP-type uncharacterized transport system fused permease subunit
MGAGAFIMAQFLGVPYIEVALAAVVPALLYYFAVMVQVHFEATRLGLKGTVVTASSPLAAAEIKGIPSYPSYSDHLLPAGRLYPPEGSLQRHPSQLCPFMAQQGDSVDPAEDNGGL